MLIEKYTTYKNTYKDYLIFIKSGNFYLALNNDAIVMNKIFNYKIKQSTNFMKVGFPLSSLNKVIQYIENKSINYVVVEDKIVQKKKYKNNNYSKYNIKLDNYEILINRINKIYEVLKNNLDSANIKETINEIEDILCKINY